MRVSAIWVVKEKEKQLEGPNVKSNCREKWTQACGEPSIDITKQNINKRKMKKQAVNKQTPHVARRARVSLHVDLSLSTLQLDRPVPLAGASATSIKLSALSKSQTTKNIPND